MFRNAILVAMSIFLTVSSFTYGSESYLNRPSILDLDLESTDIELERAQFLFVAELLEFYEGHLYFLARDSEYLQDIAKLVTTGTGEQSRIHLLNVSRKSVSSPHLLNYLIDNGITEELLRSGRQIVLIDTGFAGTIPHAIKGHFSREAKTNIRAHLIVSDSDLPSSRVFLSTYDPNSLRLPPETQQGSIEAYERIPHMSDRATHYQFENGRWHPKSSGHSTIEKDNGRISKTDSLEYMRRLKRYWQSPKIQEKFFADRLKIRNIKQLYVAKKVADLKYQLAGPDGFFVEAILRDLIEVYAKNNQPLPLHDWELGLSRVLPKNFDPRKAKLIETFPRWADYIERPYAIWDLANAGDWKTLETVFNENIHPDIDEKILEVLFSEKTSGPGKREFQMRVQKLGAKSSYNQCSQLFSN